jgi:ferredoxin-NADP reductase
MFNETLPQPNRFSFEYSHLLTPRGLQRTGLRLERGLARRARPWLDRASTRVTAKVPLLEAALARVDSTLSLHRVLARVVSVVEETHDVKTFVLRPNARFGTFVPGSYVSLHVTLNGRHLQRSYSLSSAPEGNGRIALTVKRVPGGVVSNHLHDVLAPGDVLELSAPGGHFVLRPGGDKILMLSAGSGITPVMSMLRHLVQRGASADVTFVHFARTPEDLIFKDELERVARRSPNVKLVFCVEQADGTWSGLRGRIDETLLETAAPDFRASDTYLCGPSGFMQAVMQTFERADADLSRLRFERFTTEFDASLFLEHTQTIRFTRSGVEALSNRPLTILQEAESKGLRVESGCRAGTCGTCRCKKRSGVVFNTATGEESGDGEEMISPCVSIARGTVEVDL